ncbi:MAG: hypothetical protein AAF543_17365 [Pseudomonadota bacterium]
MTPPLEDGDILPQRVVHLENLDKILTDKTIDYEPSVVFTTSPYFEEANNKLSPNLAGDSSFVLDDESISWIVSEYERWTGLSFSKKMAKLRRFHTNGKSGSKSLPFAWSVWKMREAMKSDNIDFRDEELHAANVGLLSFQNGIAQWSHHPLFNKIIADLKNDGTFYHTMSQFNIASYLFSHGNRIGFSVNNVAGKAKPDLYCKWRPPEKFFIEVKSPQVLLWRKSGIPSRESVRAKIRTELSKRRQIGRASPGMIVLANNHPSPLVHHWVVSEIDTYLRDSGIQNPYLAGAATMWAEGIRRNAERHNGIWTVYEFVPIENPGCRIQDNPLRIN